MSKVKREKKLQVIGEAIIFLGFFINLAGGDLADFPQIQLVIVMINTILVSISLGLVAYARGYSFWLGLLGMSAYINFYIGFLLLAVLLSLSREETIDESNKQLGDVFKLVIYFGAVLMLLLASLIFFV